MKEEQTYKHTFASTILVGIRICSLFLHDLKTQLMLIQRSGH